MVAMIARMQIVCMLVEDHCQNIKRLGDAFDWQTIGDLRNDDSLPIDVFQDTLNVH